MNSDLLYLARYRLTMKSIMLVSQRINSVF